MPSYHPSINPYSMTPITFILMPARPRRRLRLRREPTPCSCSWATRITLRTIRPSCHCASASLRARGEQLRQRRLHHRRSARPCHLRTLCPAVSLKYWSVICPTASLTLAISAASDATGTVERAGIAHSRAADLTRPTDRCTSHASPLQRQTLEQPRQQPAR